MAAVGHGLGHKPEADLSQDEIQHKSGNQQAPNAADQVGIPHQDDIANRSHRAKTGPLGQESDDQSGPKRDQNRRVKRAGPTLAKENCAALPELRPEETQQQQTHHHHGHNPADSRGCGIRAPQGVALLEKPDADVDPDGQSGQPDDSVEIAASQTQQGAPGASQEG